MPGDTISTIVPLSFVYNNRVGQYMERFIKGLGQKKILGVRCPKCRKVYLPPRSVCGICFSPLTKWVEVGQEGTLHSFTIGHVTIENGEITTSPTHTIIGMIKLPIATSFITAVVTGVPPKEMKPGLKVRAVWKDPMTDDLSDLDHFEVVVMSTKKAGGR